LTNLALAGVPLNGIKEYAGHASIVETHRYLRFMPESIELAAMGSSRLAQLAGGTFVNLKKRTLSKKLDPNVS
jgi:hypothetical protein